MTKPRPITEMNASELKEEAQTLRRRLQVSRLRRATSVMESMAGSDWVSQYVDLLDRYRDGQNLFSPIATPNDRRFGRNFPLFQTEQELALLRAPARVLCATNTYAIGLLSGLRCYVIGTGYKYRAVQRKSSKRTASPELLKECQEVLEEFDDRSEWPEWELELFWRKREDGEYILRHFLTGDGLTEVRSVEPEQIFQPPGANQTEWSFGVRTESSDTQTVHAYWVAYMDEITSGEEVPAEEIVHAKANSRRAVKRGLTDFCFDTLEGLETAGKLRRNMGQGAAVQAAIAGIRQHDNSSLAQVQAFQSALTDYSAPSSAGNGRMVSTAKVEPGTILDINKGLQWVDPPGAANAAAHVEILGACCRGASVRWNAPEWLGSGDASNNNFASALTAESPFVLNVLQDQRYNKKRFTRTHEIVLANAARTGRLPRDVLDMVEVQCSAPSPQARNTLQEAQETKLWMDMGLLSPQTATEQQSWDVEQEQENRKVFREKYGPLPSDQIAFGPDKVPGEKVIPKDGSGEESNPPGSKEGQSVNQ